MECLCVWSAVYRLYCVNVKGWNKGKVLFLPLLLSLLLNQWETKISVNGWAKWRRWKLVIMLQSFTSIFFMIFSFLLIYTHHYYLCLHSPFKRVIFLLLRDSKSVIDIFLRLEEDVKQRMKSYATSTPAAEKAKILGLSVPNYCVECAIAVSKFVDCAFAGMYLVFNVILLI